MYRSVKWQATASHKNCARSTNNLFAMSKKGKRKQKKEAAAAAARGSDGGCGAFADSVRAALECDKKWARGTGRT